MADVRTPYDGIGRSLHSVAQQKVIASVQFTALAGLVVWVVVKNDVLVYY